MTPPTAHLILQLIRHQKAMMTSIEKWVGTQEPCRTNIELIAVTSLMREVLESYDGQLSRRLEVAEQPQEDRVTVGA